MVNVTKRINGVDLHNESRGWSLQGNGTTVRAARAVRRSPLTVAGRHGSVTRRALPVYDEATASLAWLLEANSQSALDVTYASLVGLLTQPSLSYEHVSDDVVTAAPAELVLISEPPDFVPGEMLTVTAQLALLDPFLRDTATADVTFTAGVTTSTTLAGSAPITDSITRFHRATGGPAMNNPTVTDVTSGTGLTWQDSMTEGTYVYLDAGNLRAWRSGSSSQWTMNESDQSAQLDYAGPGRLQLWPATREVGGDLIREVKLDVSHDCAVRGRRAWL